MFLSLMQNEWTKAYYRNKFLIFGIVMLFLVAAGAGISYFFSTYDFGEPVTPITTLEFAVNSLNNLSMIVLIFTTIVLISSVTSEYKSGTMKQLLIRPISRTSILLSKWVTTFLISVLFLLILALISFLIGSVLFENEASFADSIATLGLWILYNIPTIFFYLVFGLCIAVATRNSALSISSVIVLYFIGTTITFFLLRFDWVKYLITANLTLQEYSSNEYLNFGSEPIMGSMSLGFSLGVIAVYSIILLVIAHLVFKKKDVLS
ncbi:ABC transporter permease [Alkalicoccobacillus gibsonii]|uniref:ABC transporter permease n=1 Tax=Alkalicoccobacillus gibsonii TaxID=79881 RepID=UPI001933D4D0|nr:ABC transporter permease [Alkalicoccobacillus gibsonii]MBM0065876.1 ABC transporter permease subunit [Alkalicoccobacillus gibsonii]